MHRSGTKREELALAGRLLQYMPSRGREKKGPRGEIDLKSKKSESFIIILFLSLFCLTYACSTFFFFLPSLFLSFEKSSRPLTD